VPNVKKSERDLIRSIRALSGRTANRQVRVGIGDDCAVLRPRRNEELVLTTDFSIEGRHFVRDWHEPEAIGHKCLARGLSDIAAMGARPIAAFVSLAVPRGLTRAGKGKDPWMDRFYRGLLRLAEREGVTLAGGDLSESPTLAFADIIVLGAAAKGRALLRSTARPGDLLYVTGSPGGAAAELAALAKNPRRFRGLEALTLAAELDHPHFYPQPRLRTGQALLRRRIATACIDISDGLSTDLLHLCEESRLSAEIDSNAVPIHPSATLDQALHGGDDYELLFTAGPQTRVPQRVGAVPIHRIGRMVSSEGGKTGITLTRERNGKIERVPLVAEGWQHF